MQALALEREGLRPYFACIEPNLGVGLGLALWFMLATQLKG